MGGMQSIPKETAHSAPLDFPTAAAWEKWLSRHHSQDGGAWLLIAKKGSGLASITIAEALDVALCYGWIDSHRKSCDDKHYLQRYSLRASKSPWSKINVDKAEALIASGRMQAPGLAEIQKAKADGRWAAAYESQKTAGIPPDFLAALNKSAKAKRAFGALDKTGQYAAVLPVLKAATAAVRAARVQKAMEKLAEGIVKPARLAAP
jgi:uncharacterized protein YdeI (YjbR/CyaY-like superfamily)